MLAVQECNVEDLLCVVATMVTDSLVLEVRVLGFAWFTHVFDADLCLIVGGLPAFISQSDSIAESLDTSLKHLVSDLLDTELCLDVADELFHFSHR